MASLKLRRGKWYARVIWYGDGTSKKEKQIPLRTESKTTARRRLIEVCKEETNIKSGMKFSFPWLNKDGQLKVVRLTLEQAFNDYCKTRLIDGLRKSTIERSIAAMFSFTKVVGKTTPLRSIKISHIERYKEFWSSRHKPNTVHINLSKIRTFFNWCKKHGYVDKAVQIELVKPTERPVAYLSDSDFAELMKLESVNNHFKRAFFFYRETGCRRAEPFEATLQDNWLIIEPDKSKTHRTREIELSVPLLQIFNEIIIRYNRQRETYKSKSIIDRYSKEFKKACRLIGCDDRKLNHLRDTYAVRMWAITGDIHYVSKLIGHTSVNMTEKYANFNLRRLMVDFPILKEHIEKRLNPPQIGKVDTLLVDTFKKIGILVDEG